MAVACVTPWNGKRGIEAELPLRTRLRGRSVETAITTATIRATATALTIPLHRLGCMASLPTHRAVRSGKGSPARNASISSLACATTLAADGDEQLPVAFREDLEAGRDLGQTLRDLQRGLQRRLLAAAGLGKITQIALPRRVGVAQIHDPERVGVRDHTIQPQGANEEVVVGVGSLLHDARDAAEVVGQDREGRGPPAEEPLRDREGVRAVERDDRAPALALPSSAASSGTRTPAVSTPAFSYSPPSPACQ